MFLCCPSGKHLQFAKNRKSTISSSSFGHGEMEPGSLSFRIFLYSTHSGCAITVGWLRGRPTTCIHTEWGKTKHQKGHPSHSVCNSLFSTAYLPATRNRNPLSAAPNTWGFVDCTGADGGCGRVKIRNLILFLLRFINKNRPFVRLMAGLKHNFKFNLSISFIENSQIIPQSNPCLVNRN